MVEYAKQYIEYLTSVPELLTKGGSELFERVQAEMGPISAAKALEDPSRLQPPESQDDVD